MTRSTDAYRVDVERSETKGWCFVALMTFPGVHRRPVRDETGRAVQFSSRKEARQTGHQRILREMNDYYNARSLTSPSKEEQAAAQKLFQKAG